ncbi:hypothetical protein Hanom_Chr03g00212641 [Helianthus anomalus]
MPISKEAITCNPGRIVVYIMSFTFIGVRHPLPPFKMSILKHYKMHLSQVHPLAFLTMVYYELLCGALEAKGGNYSPCYSFMPTSTYLKECKNQFIFVSPSLLSEALSLCDPNSSSGSLSSWRIRRKLPLGLQLLVLPLTPLFQEGLSTPLVPKWGITSSTIINTAKVVRDFMFNSLSVS